MMDEKIKKIPFIKMHGIGNDYVYINGFQFDLTSWSDEDLSILAQKISHRHFGIGGDGLVLILPSETDAIRMRMFNTDGSEAEMCGNAVRCVAGYGYNHGLIDKEKLDEPNKFTVETLAGQIGIEMLDDTMIRVDMGVPILKPEKIPVNVKMLKLDDPNSPLINYPIETDNYKGNFTAVSMGNPHAVYFVDDVKPLNLEKIGPDLEHHPYFPNRINSEFIQVISPNEANFRVWERGAGETWACGTGASAAIVAGRLNNKFDLKVKMHLLGGDLILETTPELDRVWMTGPYAEVAEGFYFFK